MYGSKEVSACVERVRAGETIADVSLDTGISESAISAWCRNAGVKSTHTYTHWTSDEIHTVQRMWAEGASHEDIAAALGRTVPSIEGFARKHRDVCPPRNGGMRYLKVRNEELERENERLKALLRENGIDA
jgi:hypothetical protein